MQAEIKTHNGTPTLFLDDRPSFAGYLWSNGPTATDFAMADMMRAYAKAGIQMFAFDVGTGGPCPEWCGPGPSRDGHFDFSTVEARFGRILEANPNALFHLRIHLEMGRDQGRWWRDLHREECELGSNGERTTQSFASRVWRQQAKDFLQAYATHLDATGLSQHVVAYQVGAGHTGEWVKGDTSMGVTCGDYSEPMQAHFRGWLRTTYGENTAALRAAWGDDTVTFENAAVPPAALQLTTTHMSFRDPRREQRTIDYYRCLADLCGDLVCDFCGTVKAATGGQALAGAFYGYLMELAWNAGFFGEGPDSPYSTTQRSGHLGLARVLRSPDVDFLVSPYSYGFRGVGGLGCAMPPAESLRLHGKLYIFEDDTRTHLAPLDAGFGRATSPDDSAAILKRNFAEVLTRGMGIWWLGQRTHIDPVREPDLGALLWRFTELGSFGLDLERSPVAEVAVVVDDESFYYESLRYDLDLALIFQQRLWGLAHMGTPYDTYLLQDLIEGRLPPYKLYIFLNAFHIPEARRVAIHSQLERHPCVALWLYAPGYIDQAPDLAAMTALTGFHFGSLERTWTAAMHIVDFAHPITDQLPQDLAWTTSGSVGPLFHLEDDEATILGQVVHAQGRCRPGLGVKSLGPWTSIYCAVPNLPAPLLRSLARYAGVHLYNEEGDVLFASSQLLGVHTVAGGGRTFTLPHSVDVVYDLFEQRTVAEDTACFSVSLPPRSTSLYFTGDARALPAQHLQEDAQGR
jgi:hypothetical protein